MRPSHMLPTPEMSCLRPIRHIFVPEGKAKFKSSEMEPACHFYKVLYNVRRMFQHNAAID